MTLVIDNAQKVLKQSDSFLRELQDFAKEEADKGNLRVVFVSSEFAVATFMQQHSEWSRAAKREIFESDISEAEAEAYLLQRNGWDAKDESKQALSSESSAE